MFNSACPIMPSTDFDKTIAFYAALGFTVLGVYPDAGYLLLQRDAVELHFFRFEDHVPQTSDHGVYLRVEDANALSVEDAALNLPAEDKPWGVCELAIIDPDGNLLRVGHVL